MRAILIILALLVPTMVLAQDTTESVPRLIRIMGDRLAIMDDVARYKWNHGLAVEDLERESVVLEATIARAIEAGIDPEKASAVVSAQMSAAKAIQKSLFETWEAEGADAFDNVPDLNDDLRPEIGQLTADLLASLIAAEPLLADCDLEAFAEVPPALADYPEAWSIAVGGLQTCD